MGYFTAQELLTHLSEEGIHDRSDVGKALALVCGDNNLKMFGKTTSSPDWYPRYTIIPEALNIDNCQNAIDSFHAALIEGNFAEWKALRPWKVVSITDALDPNKAWIGWEVETGWRSHEIRSRVVADFLQSQEHVCIDDEGWACGVELTWCPREVDAFASEWEHPLMFATKYIRSSEAHNPTDEVGTHINVSSPAFRDGSSAVKRGVLSAFNNMLDGLSHDQKEKLFGRGRLYGGFFLQGDPDSSKAWLEGKLFNSTYSKPVARGYIAVGDRIAALMEAVAVAVTGYGRAMGGTTIDNAYAFLSGKADTPSITVSDGSVASFYEEGDDPEDWGPDEACECWECRHARGEVDDDDEEDYY